MPIAGRTTCRATCWRGWSVTRRPERCCRHALSLEPNNAPLLFNLGNTYLRADRIEEAVAIYRAAIAADPQYFDPYHNLGHAYNELGRPADAEACFRKGTELRPDDFNPHMKLGMTLIAQGRHQEGWREYQWRLHDKVQLPSRGFTQPPWQGESLAGKTLLLSSEQGAGDAIMFMRYLPMLLAQGGKVIVECLPPLRRLFEHIAGLERVVLKGEALPDFDTCVAPIDLPLYFNTTVETVPANVPYLPWPTPTRSWQYGSTPHRGGASAWSGPATPAIGSTAGARSTSTSGIWPASCARWI